MAALIAGVVACASVLYVATAGIGVLAAYDRGAALVRFVLLAAGFLLFVPLSWLGAGDPGRTAAGVLSLGSLAAAAALSAYFLLTYDLHTAETHFAAVSALAEPLLALRPSVTLTDTVNPNVAGGALIILLLTGTGGLLWLLRRRSLFLKIVLLLLLLPALLFAGLTLVITESRGAWAAGVAGAATLAFALWRSGSSHHRAVRQAADAAALLGALVLAAAIAFVLAAPAQAGGILTHLGGSTALGRAQLWPDGRAIVADYRFTGSGLGSTMMVYSTYYLLLHVGHTSHMHNLYLEIAVQQGVPGLIAFLCLAAGTAVLLAITLAEGTPGRRRLAAGALAALVALLVHGLVDAGLYASRLAPLLALPLAVAWPIRPRRRADDCVAWGSLSFLGAAIPAALIALAFVWPGSRAAFQANLGAVEQTVAELSVYEQPAWPLQDDLRRAGGVDLAAAEARYTAALLLDPGNVTAHQRLGQIALARGDLDAAERHLAAAYADAPDRRPVRQLLGEIYALQCEPERGVQLWQSLDLRAGQLQAREFWYGHVEQPERLQRLRAAIAAWRAQQ
jgi:O-antigen ligase